MRLPSRPVDAVIASVVLFPLLSAAVNFDCEHIQADGKGFNLKSLAGPYTLSHQADAGNNWLNTTYSIDLCSPLKKKKGGDTKTDCPLNTQICAVEHLIPKDDETKGVLKQTFAIVGDFHEKGRDMDSKFHLLSKQAGHEDSKKEGILLEFGGGLRTEETQKRKQKAIIEFICDKARTGLEGLISERDLYEESLTKREDAATTPSLIFESYAADKSDASIDVLRLTWKTKEACEDAKEQKDAENRSHWGFFTWFVLIAFLSTAAYLIFGSWLNYNRYGARGWDLLPHGDIIRDVPYLVKDFSRRIVNSIQGGGSRGGYAAV
ncbi:hypothetical protein HYALB_00000089 [Hymenoscyphus albidus]|uniref:Autophagy-related protein 27 n=1 Tax=Hymenoscyphus albidus TaxID=595503 RepID=A0A9N9LKT8_9HELO|nr:hypothetical protein HYALB_00000089 [Hymenoscyphus albidus]